MSIETMKQAMEALGKCRYRSLADEIVDPAITALRTAIAEAEKQEPVTILPDGSAFGVMSFPLPDDHWLYAPNEYRDGEYEPIDLPKPILTHALREAVVAAVRYAVRGATMMGQETDFDPDALVQNAVYALCGPYTTPPAAQRQPHEWIAVDECMPEPGAYVLAVFRYTTGKQRVIRAMHAPQKTLSEDDYGEFVTEGADYDEATDTTYWPEGWYECNENEETHWQVHEEVTHWMPLPAAPSVGEKPDAA